MCVSQVAVEHAAIQTETVPRQQVFELTKKPPFAADFKLRSQLDDAADSVCRNIAEGSACKSDKESAKFVRIARRSLNEVQDCFRRATLKQRRR
jgi:four helix bundle protein